MQSASGNLTASVFWEGPGVAFSVIRLCLLVLRYEGTLSCFKAIEIPVLSEWIVMLSVCLSVHIDSPFGPRPASVCEEALHSGNP